MRKNYVRPLAEVIKLDVKDIIRTSGALNDTVNEIAAKTSGALSYDDAFNQSSGNRITLN